MSLARGQVGFRTAAALVVANIIGTGIFTTTGFLSSDVPSPIGILIAWALGGVLALCGALSYGELAAAMPQSGGEYHYLSKIYHPALGFLSGFVSLFAGFAAPIAASATAFAKHFHIVAPMIPEPVAALLIIILMTFLHTWDLHIGSRTQNVFTVAKITLIIGFIICGFVFGKASAGFSLSFRGDEFSMLTSGKFAVGLIYISFAYSGWNAAAYIAGEVQNPERNVPKSLILGTGTVMVLYLLLNLVFVYILTIPEMQGQLAIGDLTARAIFGDVGGSIVSTLIALALVSSVSSMVMAGPRITAAMGKDTQGLQWLGKNNKRGLPLNAFLIQLVIAITYVLTASFEDTLRYIGFTLSLFAFLTVLGVFVYRVKHPEWIPKYKTPGYPVVPALFLVLSAWIVIYTIIENYKTAIAGFGTIALGLVIYMATNQHKNKTT
ncbi:MAG: amino acid permease [Bacteroidia bacterium]|nr:amino acid permease [Bacteroidia bacterium]